MEGVDKDCFVANIHIHGDPTVHLETLEALVKDGKLSSANNFGEVIQNANTTVESLKGHRIFSTCSAHIKRSSEESNLSEKHVHSFSLPRNVLRTRDTVDVSLVLEAKRRQVGGSIGYQLHENVDHGLEGKLNHYNLNGRLEKLDLAFFWGWKTKYVNIGLVKPIFHHSFIRSYEIRMLGNRENRKEYSSFTQDSLGISVGANLKEGHSLTYHAVCRNVILDRHISSSVTLDGGLSFKSSLVHKWHMENRENPIIPISGKSLIVKHELAGLGGDTHFIKQEISSQQNYPLSREGWGLNFCTQFGALMSLRGQKSSVCDRFFLGGAPIRGFQSTTIGPVHNKDRTGGEVFFAQGLHLTIPFVESIPQELAWHVFTNYGSCVLLDRENLLQTGRNLVESTRVSAGIGLLWDSPLGRLELNLCRALRKEETDFPRNWDFSIRAFF